jgi:NADPH-dependent glutamate synthase beta subunit-like oxidoreductase
MISFHQIYHLWPKSSMQGRRGPLSFIGGAINSYCCVSHKTYYYAQITMRKTTEEIALRVAVLGGGPAGLYFPALWKTRHPRDHVTVFEQNPERLDLRLRRRLLGPQSAMI